MAPSSLPALTRLSRKIVDHVQIQRVVLHFCANVLYCRPEASAGCFYRQIDCQLASLNYLYRVDAVVERCLNERRNKTADQRVNAIEIDGLDVYAAENGLLRSVEAQLEICLSPAGKLQTAERRTVIAGKRERRRDVVVRKIYCGFNAAALGQNGYAAVARLLSLD